MDSLRISSADPQLHAGDYLCIASLEGGVEETVSFNITVQCKLYSQVQC